MTVSYFIYLFFYVLDFIKYKIDRYSEAGDMRLSGSLHIHLLSGRGLKTAGKYKRFRDLYCVVEVDHVHKVSEIGSLVKTLKIGGQMVSFQGQSLPSHWNFSHLVPFL